MSRTQEIDKEKLVELMGEVHKNLSINKAKIIARKIGVEVDHNSKGELVFSGNGLKVVRNAQKKDAGKMLVSMLREAIRRMLGLKPKTSSAEKTRRALAHSPKPDSLRKQR